MKQFFCNFFLKNLDDVVVIENDSLLKQIMKWNSSENLLTLVEEEKEQYESTEILFFLKLVTFLFF